jgi:hypothetical protein
MTLRQKCKSILLEIINDAEYFILPVNLVYRMEHIVSDLSHYDVAVICPMHDRGIQMQTTHSPIHLNVK